MGSQDSPGESGEPGPCSAGPAQDMQENHSECQNWNTAPVQAVLPLQITVLPTQLSPQAAGLQEHSSHNTPAAPEHPPAQPGAASLGKPRGRRCSALWHLLHQAPKHPAEKNHSGKLYLVIVCWIRTSRA